MYGPLGLRPGRAAIWICELRFSGVAGLVLKRTNPGSFFSRVGAPGGTPHPGPRRESVYTITRFGWVNISLLGPGVGGTPTITASVVQLSPLRNPNQGPPATQHARFHSRIIKKVSELFGKTTLLELGKKKKKESAGKKHLKLVSHWENCSPCRERSCSSIRHYPNCSEERTQLGSGYWIFATPLNKLIKRGTRRHPRFNTNL